MGFRYWPHAAAARAAAAALLLVAYALPAAELLRVGPGRQYERPSEAAAAARNGAIVEIDAGTYEGDVAIWRQDGLTIRGVGGYAHIKAAGRAAEQKAIWVIKGHGTTIERLEFSGARVADRNGAGVRQEGRDLTVRHCLFHDNENGILGGAGNVLIEYSEFADNGFGDGQSHNIYISERTERFVLRGSYVRGARMGHNVKSRARENRILYNWIMDGAAGTPSYSVDIPNGGLAFVIGNVIQQAREPENAILLSYGAEGYRSADAAGLYVVNNTFVNEHHGGVFIRSADGAPPARIVNNLFVGAGRPVQGTADTVSNRMAPAFPAGATGYRPAAGSIGVDEGIDPGVVGDFDLTPTHEYRHPLALVARRTQGKLDIGAYEATKRAH